MNPHLQDYVVQTLWESREAFEAWSADRGAQQQAGEQAQMGGRQMSRCRWGADIL